MDDSTVSGEPSLDEATQTLSTAEQAALDALAGKLTRGESWKPQDAGDRIVGKALGWETVAPRDDQKKRCEVLTLLTANGPVTVWTYNKQLKTRLIKPETSTQAEAEAIPHAERLVQLGDLVAVEYAGEFAHPTEEGQTYKRFLVEISRPVVAASESAQNRDDIPW